MSCSSRWPRALLFAGVASLAFTCPTQAAETRPVEEGTVEAVVVTAQKREERLTEVPLAISVTSGDALRKRNVNNLEQIMTLVPALKVATPYQGGAPSITLRGIGPANQYNMNTNAPIGLYMDEVYLAFVPAPGVQFFDLERVEVLKGPQGTLYGRNTTGGLINFISRRPDMEGGYNGEAEVGYGSRDRWKAQAAADVQLAPEVLAARLSLYRSKGDGYMRNAGPVGPKTFGDDDTWQGRLTVELHPSRDLEAILRVYSSKSLNTGSGPVGLGVGPGGSNAFGYVRTGLDRHEVLYDYVDGVTKTGSSNTALTLNWSLGDVTLTSITSGVWSMARLSDDCDGTISPICSTDNHISGRQFSQDVRLQYTGERLKLTAGAFYGADEIDYDTDVQFFSAVFLRNIYEQDRESYAIYADGAYAVTDQLEVTLGLRQTFDKVELHDAQTLVLDAFYGTPVASTIPLSPTYAPSLVLPPRSRTPDELTGRLVAKYQFTPDIMAYASFSHGYRVGAFNGQAFFDPNEFNYVPPEEVDNYELGLKATLLERRVVLSAATFNTHISNQHVLSTINVPGLAAFPGLAGLSGRSRGFELDVTAAVSRDVQLRGSLSVLDTRYDDGESLNGVDVGGNRFAQAPQLAGQAGVDWRLWSRENQAVTASFDVSYSGQYYFDPENGESAVGPILRDGQSSFWLLEGRLAYEVGAVTVALWGKNLTNETYVTFVGNAEGAFGTDFVVLGEPRAYGVTLTTRF